MATALDLGDPTTFSGLTSFGNMYSANLPDSDAHAVGTVSGVTIADTGDIVVRFDNGEQKTIGKIPIVKFENVNDLELGPSGGRRITATSGDPILYEAKTNGAGAVSAENLEH